MPLWQLTLQQFLDLTAIPQYVFSDHICEVYVASCARLLEGSQANLSGDHVLELELQVKLHLEYLIEHESSFIIATEIELLHFLQPVGSEKSFFEFSSDDCPKFQVLK